jgi:pyridinium-3,5-biscarboxylic acid mononucleotide synthase
MSDLPVSDVPVTRLDVDRLHRTGDPEVVLASHKTPDQTTAALNGLRIAHPERAVMATRCDEPTRAACRTRLPDAWVDEVARTVVVGPVPEPRGSVVVVTAGTSDVPVASEAMVTAQVFGVSATLLPDLGVAGLHRLLGELDAISAADAVIAVAGMDGALPGVIAGLVAAPVIAVPTSVGSGASLGGLAALLTMLNACAPGVSVVNIDNGFGAAVCAARAIRAIRRRARTS